MVIPADYRDRRIFEHYVSWFSNVFNQYRLKRFGSKLLTFYTKRSVPP